MKFYNSFKNYIKESSEVNTKPIKIGEKSERVNELQSSLEKMGMKLNKFGIDSIFGYETLGVTDALFSMIKTNSNLSKHVDDKKLLDIKDKQITNEQMLLIKDLSMDDKFLRKINRGFKKLNKKIEKFNLEGLGSKRIFKNIEQPLKFIEKLKDVSKELGINPEWLIKVMFIESNIDPKAVNPYTGASGLIQFMPSTSKSLGTSVSQIRKMSAIEQLDLVEKYYKSFPQHRNLSSYSFDDDRGFIDLYLLTFYPASVGKDDDYLIGNSSNKELIAKQNSIYDINNNREITKGEIADVITKKTRNV